jgi:hypothetical protein
MNNMTKDGAPLKAGIIYSDGARDSARMTWLIEEAHAGRQHLDATVKREYARQYIDLMMAQTPPAETNADAERARWCQGMKAEVAWSTTSQRWIVAWYDWYEDAYMQRHVSDPDRDTAIDKARGVK